MISLGLTSKEMTKLKALLVTHHSIDVVIQLLTLEHVNVGDISDMLISGQVNIDAAATEHTRSCSLEFLDPKHTLKLDASAPEDGSLYMNRMVKVIFVVRSIDRNQEYSIPIFCGPLSAVDRTGLVVSVSAVGKESLSMASVWKSLTYRQGTFKVSVIRSLMSGYAGERKLDFSEPKAKLPKKLSINREHTAWTAAKRLAGSMGQQLFYDGRGVLRLRPLPRKSVYTFSEKGALLTLPNAQYSLDGLVNAVQVIGGKPKGAKKKVTLRVVAPRSHPLSPWALGRWNKPRYLPETIEDGNIGSKREARAVARARLREAMLQSVQVSFDSLPIPFLEENDLVRVVSDTYSGSFRLKQMSIPLTADGVSSIGYLRKVTPKRRVRRRRKPRKAAVSR